MALSLVPRRIGAVTVVSCTGRIVFGDETTELWKGVRAVLADTRNIVLDLKEVSYIDSGGLGVLVGLYLSARKSGGEIKLANFTHRVDDEFRITKLITIFDCHNSEDDAIRAFSDRSSVA